MSLHDRIMKLNPDNEKPLPSERCGFDYGYRLAGLRCADMAEEADELMEDMASMIDSLVGMYALKHCDDAMKSDECREACELMDRYNTYKERKQ